MKFKTLTFASTVSALVVMAASGISWAVEPIKLRYASDHSGPPHPAGIAELYFAERLEKRVPGSRVQIYWAKGLYNVPDGTEAMTAGNLEMMTGQFGKTSSLDSYMNVVVGAGLLTTPGAINQLDKTKTFQALVKRFEKVHDIKIFGSGHLSMYMGAGAVKSRLLKPSDFKGQKIRSMGPAENALLGALGANPTTMAFGDVPPALQTGVIDGLLTSLGGFNATKEQAPYFTVAGLNGIVGDYYWIGGSNRYWNKLSKAQQSVLTDVIINDFLPFQKKVNFCNDKRTLNKFITKDKKAPGIYVMSQAESAVIQKAEGGATDRWIKTKVNDVGDKLVDKFTAEAKALVKANPPGSHSLESTDCSKYEKYFAKYGKGSEMYKAKKRK